jgi:hypothetical protein
MTRKSVLATRKAVLTGVAALATFLLLPVAASSAQVRPSVVGTGVTTCAGAWTGKVVFTPPLVTGGTKTTEGVSITAKVATCTGGTPTPTFGKLDGKGVINMAGANNCLNYFATPVPPGGTDTLTFSPSFGGAIYWSPTNINPSSYSLTSMTTTTTAPASPVTFSAPSVTVTGSYAATGSFSFNTRKTVATILSAATGDCGSTSGLSKLKIAALGSAGNF